MEITKLYNNKSYIFWRWSKFIWNLYRVAGNDSTHVRQVQQRANSPQRPQQWACALPWERLRAPSPVRTRRSRRPKKAQQTRREVLGLGELWPFVGRRRHHAGRWLAVERASRRVVARVSGRRGAATARRLWAALPGRYRRHCGCFTDRFPASARAWPTGTHRPSPKGEG